MGRELRRKQAKKEGKSLVKEELIEKNPIKKMIIITCALLFTAIIIYLGTALFITKELDWFSKDKKETTENKTVENSILAKAIFNQSEKEYYVYFYDFNDEETNVTSIITGKLSGSKIYRVDTSSSLNSKYVGSPSNKTAKKLDQLKVVAPTLIKITDGNITAYYEKTEIANNL